MERRRKNKQKNDSWDEGAKSLSEREIRLPVYKYRYFLLPVTSFGLGVPRWRETAGNKENKGKMTKKLREKKPQIQDKQPRFCGCLLGPF